MIIFCLFICLFGEGDCTVTLGSGHFPRAQVVCAQYLCVGSCEINIYSGYLTCRALQHANNSTNQNNSQNN